MAESLAGAGRAAAGPEALPPGAAAAPFRAGGSPSPQSATSGDGQAPLIAGFDAGQTHTTCRLADARSGRCVAEGQGPGVSHLAASDGPQRFQAALRGSLAAALSQLPEPSRLATVLKAAAVGASGIESGAAVQRHGQDLAAEVLGLHPDRLWLGGDERTALRGAFPAGAGIIVISGTGTIALGRDACGREHRCAGWGWLLDGAGSAFDIGRDGLSLTLEMADGRRPAGALLQRLWHGLALDPADPASPQAIKARVVSPGFVPAGLARLAPLVEAAAAEDREALAILRRHGEALAASVAGVAAALDLEAPPVAALGGAITHLPLFRRQFVQALAQRLPAAGLREPAGDAAAGALAIAAELAAGQASPG